MRRLSFAIPAVPALVLASVLSTLIALGALGFAGWRDYKDALRGTEALGQQAARLLEEHTQRYVSAPEQALRRLDERFSEQPIGGLGSERVRRAAEAIAAELPQVGSLFIADREGRVVMLSGYPRHAPIDVSDRQYFRAHMIEGRTETVVGPLIHSREPLPRYAFTVSRPLIRDGQMVGIIAATMDVAFFLDFYDSIGLGDRATFALFNEQGWLVMRKGISDEILNRNFSHLSLFTDHLPNAPTGTYIRPSILDGGLVRVFSYRRVAGLPLVVNAGIPLDEVISGWRTRTLRNAAIVLGLLMLVQGALWLAWRGVRRERELTAGLRRALDDNTTLFNEIHHRVKNNMQIVSSMLMIEQIRAGGGPLAERLQLVAERVSSMALVHTMLYERHEASRVNLGAYLGELCANLAEGHGAGERGIRIEVSADDSHCGMDLAVPLGLLVNEAVANALKHAFPAGRPGTIRVHFAGAGATGFVLEVADDGIGLSAQPRGNGIGTTLIRSLAGQLDARLVVEGCAQGPGTLVRVSRGDAAAWARSPARAEA